MVLALAGALLAFRGWLIERPITAERINADRRHAYVAQLPDWINSRWARVRFDSPAAPQSSRLKIFENGRALGPPHSEHQTIRDIGGGRYSHWNEGATVYFSSSDGSDPRNNGRNYSFAVRVRLAAPIGWTAVLTLVALAMAERRLLVRAARSVGMRTVAVAASLPTRLALASFGAIGLAWLVLDDTKLEQRIDAVDVAPVAGYSYQARLPEWRVAWPLRIPFDSPTGTRASNASVQENGVPLGPAHSEHDVISRSGGGSFSHWGEARNLYFSASDNSDPRSNGREYRVSVQAQAPSWLLVVAAALAVVALTATWRLARGLAASARERVRATALRAGRGISAMQRIAIALMVAMETRLARLLYRLEPLALRARRVGTAVFGWLRSNALPPLLGGVVALLFVFGVGEAYFRLTVPFIETTWPSQVVDGVGWLFKPNSIVRVTNEIDFWAESETNSYGFLDRELPKEIPASACRVAFIGDSFVEAAQVRNEDKMQAALERVAQRRGGPQVVAAGFGFSGTGQLNQLPFYDIYARRFEPHLVVLVFVANDFANNSNVLEGVRHGFHPNHAPRIFAAKDPQTGAILLTKTDPHWHEYLIPVSPDTVPPDCALCGAHRSILSWSVFYRWITLKLRLLAPHLLRPMEPPAAKSIFEARAEWIARQPEFAGELGSWNGKVDIDQMFYAKELPPAFEKAIEYTGFALQEFKTRVIRDGGRLLVLSASHLRRRGAPEEDRYFNRLLALTSRLQIDVLDQRAWLDMHSMSTADIQYRHDGHWNPRGHEVAAEMVMDYLVRNPDVCRAPQP